jgi:hypothetical protein
MAIYDIRNTVGAGVLRFVKGLWSTVIGVGEVAIGVTGIGLAAASLPFVPVFAGIDTALKGKPYLNSLRDNLRNAGSFAQEGGLLALTGLARAFLPKPAFESLEPTLTEAKRHVNSYNHAQGGNTRVASEITTETVRATQEGVAASQSSANGGTNIFTNREHNRRRAKSESSDGQGLY